MHLAAGQLQEPMYLLAATIAEPERCDAVREDLRELVIGRARKIHWRDESAMRQTQIASVIARHELLHTVVVVEFALPSSEPMLWVPDAVAGAVGAQRKAMNSAPYALLNGMIHEIELKLR